MHRQPSWHIYHRPHAPQKAMNVAQQNVENWHKALSFCFQFNFEGKFDCVFLTMDFVNDNIG